MKDFTVKTYRRLLESLRERGYEFVTFRDYCATHPKGRFVILRHDVDLRADHSLVIAQVEAEMGIKASYYFRVVPESNQPAIIHAIAKMGHEIGYHYEDLSITHGDTEQAMEHFREWLGYFRQFYPVETICMHGAPTSRYDGRELWRTCDYRDEGIIGEPYFDCDFTDLFYLTDTGRCWDGYRFSVRDKVAQQDEWIRQGLVYHTTEELISRDLPERMMITTHPQRWTDQRTLWWKEYLLQHIKNTIKRILIWVKE